MFATFKCVERLKEINGQANMHAQTSSFIILENTYLYGKCKTCMEVKITIVQEITGNKTLSFPTAGYTNTRKNSMKGDIEISTHDFIINTAQYQTNKALIKKWSYVKEITLKIYQVVGRDYKVGDGYLGNLKEKTHTF